MDLELKGKTAIVTGGSRGIGKAIARELANEGSDVAIVARGQEDLDKTAIELAKDTGVRIIPVVADTSSDKSVREMVAQAVSTLGGVDILVNCAAKPAGLNPPPRLSEITEGLFWEDVNVKVMGYLRCAREVAPFMREKCWGRIISVSGLSARKSGSIVGSIRNVALVAMTKNLADELGPFGINVTAVHPGYTRTERTEGTILAQANSRGMLPEDIESEIRSSNSLRRIIDASEVAYVVAFLASSKGAAIHGDVVSVGGGEGTGIYY